MSAGRDLGVDTFYMSYHQAARPACSHIQGHIVTEGKSFRVPASKDPDIGMVYSLNDYGYGEPSGVRGINCRHVLTPFMIGINTMPDRSDLPSPADAEANGKFQAQQRAIERSVRDAKYKLRAAELLNDEPLKARYKAKINNQQRSLNQLIAQHDFLHRDYSRTKAYLTNNKFVDDRYNKLEDSIIPTYNRFKKDMGSKAPTYEQWRSARNNPTEMNLIKGRAHTIRKLNNGTWTGKIYPPEQAHHLSTTVATKKGLKSSFFPDDINAQALIDKYSGTGTLDRTDSGKNWSNIEIVNPIPGIEGTVVLKNGKTVAATGIKIHYSAGKTHIVPYCKE